MKPRWNLFAALLLAALAAPPPPAFSLSLPPAPGGLTPLRAPGFAGSHPFPTPWMPGEVVVGFRATVPAARRELLVNTSGCRIAHFDPGSGCALVQVREDRVADMIGLLARQPEVLLAEPNYRAYFQDTSYYDPYEWYLFDRGTISAQRPSNYGIEAASAWKQTKGAGVTVAVVDSGVAFEDYNGFYQAPALSQTQFAPGYNALDGSSHPNDDFGHGTVVAEVIASNLVDGAGITGVAPAATVLPVKVGGPDGTSDYYGAMGIRWAVDNGAQVLNMSWGSAQADPLLANALDYAASKDCVLVASSGNNTPPTAVGYPAAYSSCLAVGAIGFDGGRVPYSDYGASLALVAPGGNLSEDLNGDGAPDGIVGQTFDPKQGFDSFGFQFWEGTSFSSPMVAGVAALVRAANPSLSAIDVRTLLESTARHLGATGRNKYYGYGLVDAAAAVNAATAALAGPQQGGG